MPKKDDAVTEVVVAEEEAKPAPPVKEKPKVVANPYPSHTSFSAFLGKYVSGAGVVNYKGMMSGKSALESYTAELAKKVPDASWPRKEALAYWINAYNAFTIKLILDNYPVSSITDLHGGKPWDKKWISLAGDTYSLNQIENDIIRPTYNEPRIHFAVNCAAKSCPPLANKAFTASNMESLLESQTKKFINDKAHNAISGNGAEISKIFEWYGVDFGDLKSFLNKYLPTSISQDAELSYKEYNWALNE